jgi:RNase P/RNase MRP subunit POP5
MISLNSSLLSAAVALLPFAGNAIAAETTSPAASGELAAASAKTAMVKIENDLYAVEYNSAQGDFRIQHKPSGKTFAQDGRLENGGGTASLKAVSDKTFGQGRGIEIVHPNGNSDTLALYPNLPFVLFSTSLKNGTAAMQTLNKVPTFSMAVDTGTTLPNVKTLGTGGLLAPEKNPGSYAFLAIVNPASRSGAVGGWLTHDRGSGVVFSPVQDGTVRLQARVEYGCLRIKPGEHSVTETFAVGWFDDARFGLESYADAIVKVYSIKLPPAPAGFCTWYMEKYSGACDEAHLPQVTAVAAKELKPFGFDFIQIDDKWQDGISSNGPKKNFTTHAPKGPYPSGMKAAADNIKKLGLVPGIWFMPFAGNYLDPWFKDHQNWFVKDPNGKPYETAWGGTCLDMTNPDTQEYVRGIVRRISQEWGYKVFKMDGYWTGSATKQVYVNSGYKEDGMGDATFADPNKTNIEALRDGTKLVRAAAGPDVFLLGCCISQNMRSFGGTFGLLDAMRVGPDTGGNIGSPNASPVWFLNGRVWWNDPDCVMVRTKFPVKRAQLNASWTAISGQLFYNSDWMPDLPADRLDILKRCIPAHGLFSRPVDVFDARIAQIWLLTDTRQTIRRDVVALYNWDGTEKTVSATVDRIGLPKAQEYVAFNFWANKFVPPFRDTISAILPGDSCRVLAVRPVSNVPQLLSTSRHVTQGIVDVTGEKWDAVKSALSGVSKVVEDDAYELRIVVPVGENSWRAAGVNISAEDVAAGVKVTYKQNGPKLRVTIQSPTSRDVRWSIQFEPGMLKVLPPPAVTKLEAHSDYQGVKLTWAADDAEAYRINRNDGKVFTTVENTFFDNPPKTANYRYTVTALGWTETATATGTVVETAFEALKSPPTPALPTIHLSDLQAIKVSNGWKNKEQSNKSIKGAPLTINKKTYEKGIGTLANALSIYAIPKGATRFVAVVGLDDAANDPKVGVVFKVYGDVKEMGEPPELLAESPVLCSKTLRNWAFDLELNSRFRELHLVVTDTGNDCWYNYGNWVNVGFIAKDQK